MTTTVNQANHECFALMLSQRGAMGVAMDGTAARTHTQVRAAEATSASRRDGWAQDAVAAA